MSKYEYKTCHYLEHDIAVWIGRQERKCPGWVFVQALQIGVGTVEGQQMGRAIFRRVNPKWGKQGDL